jgi:hypothetical protein
MPRKVFYSWQSDRPNATNRGLILTALKAACADLGEDPTIDERPEVDHDTQGVPGAPDIVQTIFAKIDGANVFVADVSIITTDNESRPCPNPNVLIELGYAIKTLGWSRIILVMNTSFGGPELLPFDLKTKRVTPYRSAPEDTERAPERKKLQSILQAGLKIIFEHSAQPMPGMEIKPALPGDLARQAVGDGKPNAASAVRRFMQWFGDQLDEVAPDKDVTPADEALVQALDRTVPLLSEFGKLAEVICSHDAGEAAMALFKGFEHVLARYDIKQGFVGSSYDTDFDLAKFVGHEALVMLVAYLIREERWSLLAVVFGEELVVASGRGTHSHRFERISMHVKLLDQRKQRLGLNRASLHADLLKERHEVGELSKLITFTEFVQSDFFLFLRNELERSTGAASSFWYPRTAVFMGEVEPPRFLLQAKSTAFAERLAPALGVAGAIPLREGLTAAKPHISKTLREAGTFWDGPLRDFDPSTIASR